MIHQTIPGKSKLIYVPAGVNLYKIPAGIEINTKPSIVEYHTLKKPKDLLILQSFQDKMRVLYEGQAWYVNKKDTYGGE